MNREEELKFLLEASKDSKLPMTDLIRLSWSLELAQIILADIAKDTRDVF